VSLLIGNANQIRHLLLGKAQHDATFADALTNITVSVCGAVCAFRFFVLSILSHFIIRYQPPVIIPHFGCCRVRCFSRYVTPIAAPFRHCDFDDLYLNIGQIIITAFRQKLAI